MPNRYNEHAIDPLLLHLAQHHRHGTARPVHKREFVSGTKGFQFCRKPSTHAVPSTRSKEKKAGAQWKISSPKELSVMSNGSTFNAVSTS